MNGSKPQSAFRLFCGLAVLVVLAGLLVRQSPWILSPFADHRLDSVREGDRIRVRKVSGGVRLEVYSKQSFAPDKCHESLRVYLESLPVVKSASTESLVLAGANGNEETILTASILDLQEPLPPLDAKDPFQPPEMTIDESDFQRFGELSLSSHQALIDQVAASDGTVSAALLNSIKGETLQTVQDEVRRFRKLEIDECLANSDDDADSKAACRLFLDAYFDLTSGISTAMSVEAIEQLAKNALAVSDNPTVRLYAARHEFNLGHVQESQRQVTELLSIKSDAFAPTTRFVSRAIQLSAFRPPNGTALGSAHARAIDDFIVSSGEFQAVLKAHPEGLAFAWSVYHSVWPNLGDSGREKLLKSLFDDKDSDPWLCHSLACFWHYHEGWRIRGNAYISEVPKQDQMQFAARLNLAACHALSASGLQPRLSFPIVMLVEMARTGAVPIGGTRAWFLHGVRSTFDEIGFYEAYLLSLSPKWGGSHEQMMAFAGACAGCSRFETDVPAFAMECIEAIQKDIRQQDGQSARAENVWKRPEVMTLMQGFRTSLPVQSADPAVAGHVHRALERCLAIAVHSDSMPEARAIFDLLGDSVEYSWFSHYELPPGPDVRRQVYAESSPARELIAEFDALIAGQQGFARFIADPAAIRQKLEAIRSADDSPISQEYCESKAVLLNRWEQFAAGASVSLPFSNTDQSWNLFAGDGVLEEDAFRIPANPDRKQPVYAQLGTYFPVPFQLSVDLSLAASSDARNSAGILVADGEVPRNGKSPPGVFVYLSHPRHAVWWSASGGRSNLISELSLTSVNRLQISVYKDHFEVSVNGAVAGTIPRTSSAADAAILLGSPVFSLTSAESTFRNCSIQKITGTLP
ncbi:MAG: hypothetical protein JNM43_06175 [Planctomycetaceae bacterium]|nr:hypothetical protein [Planctomycetaceae bacterium]